MSFHTDDAFIFHPQTGHRHPFASASSCPECRSQRTDAATKGDAVAAAKARAAERDRARYVQTGAEQQRPAPAAPAPAPSGGVDAAKARMMARNAGAYKPTGK
jgi:hypothetical protein